MSVLVYRKGSTHTINGISCEMAKIEPKSLQPHIDAGWCLTVEDVYAEPNYSEPEEVIEAPEDEEQAEYREEVEETIEELEEAPELPTKKEIDTNGSGKLSNKEIRAAAQNMGIDDWDTARIATLKEKLGI